MVETYKMTSAEIVKDYKERSVTEIEAEIEATKLLYEANPNFFDKEMHLVETIVKNTPQEYIGNIKNMNLKRLTDKEYALNFGFKESDIKNDDDLVMFKNSLILLMALRRKIKEEKQSSFQNLKLAADKFIKEEQKSSLKQAAIDFTQDENHRYKAIRKRLEELEVVAA